MARPEREPGRVLLTGFDPFDREPVNPSWEAALALDGWQCLGRDTAGRSGGDVAATVHARRLPCVFGEALEVLDRAIAELRPTLVLAVGQAGGRSELSIERVAINLDDGRIADNAGHQPIDLPVVADGPAAYFATVPIKAIVRDLRRAGIPASVSNTAGTFVCNHVFYGLMHRLAVAAQAADPEAAAGTRNAPVRGGFIHIPFLTEQAARHPGQPSMALATIVDGLRIAIATACSIRYDITETGGQLH